MGDTVMMAFRVMLVMLLGLLSVPAPAGVLQNVEAGVTAQMCGGIGAALHAAQLRCEYRANPLGVDVAQPRLSWVLEGDPTVRGQRQTQYRILVASTPEILERDEGDLWDTGVVASDESAHIRYQGAVLRSGMVCHWKVQVWDGSGAASAWTEPAFWTMGLLEASDWQAQWIGGATPDALKSETLLPAVYLRKTFTLAKAVKRAVVYATAAGLYEFHINGQRVGEDFFTPGWTEYAKRLYYQGYDVTALLRGDGENVWGAVLGDGWFGLHHNGRGRLRLLAQMHVEYEDGTADRIATDGTWTATMDGPVRASDIYDGERYDARKEMPGWSAPGFDAAAWGPVLVGAADQSTWVDVTAKVREAIHDNTLSIAATNANFGDPACGVRKSLMAKYTLDGVEHTEKVEENKTLEVAGGAAALGLVEARYGVDAGTVERAVLQAYPGVPVRRTEEITPVSVAEAAPGAFVFDLGQNFSGWARLTVSGPAGTEVTLRFAEVLNPDGTIYTINLRKAKCTDTYVLKGDRLETWEPRFTFHGFRYVEVTGYPATPSKDAIRGIVVHSDAPRTSSFECSNPMLNKLFSNIVWGQRSNFLEVPTDCPQRDERMGWSGDAQAFVGTATYNMDVAAFFTAWMQTFNDAQDASGGYPNIAPKGGGVSPGWGDAGVVCPWALYRMYGDTALIERHYDGMARWIAYLEERSKDLVRPDEGFGDWVSVNADTPKDVISTAYFAYSTRLLSEMARAIGRDADAERYADLFERIKAAFNKAFVTEKGRVEGNTQTAYLLALGFDLLPDRGASGAAAEGPEPAAQERHTESLRQEAADRLIDRIEARDWHLSVGFLGANLLIPVLSEIGRLDVAYRLLENETYPSWLYCVANGATTIWERWDSYRHDKGFQDPGMNSFNHYAFGAVGQWFFDTLAGIAPESPGFKRIRIAPRPGGSLTEAKARYDSIRGPVATHWQRMDQALRLEVTVPPNTTATVHVPAEESAAITESGIAADKAPGVRFLRREAGAAVYEIGSGKYLFEAMQR